MRWKQLFFPVQSIDPEQAAKMMEQSVSGEVGILDVRQPQEYEQGHLPGAKLIPLPELEKRLSELDADKPHIVYCASGGRSRVAAQTLADHGFGRAYNLKGGFKAWQGRAAVGSEETGMHVFAGASRKMGLSPQGPHRAQVHAALPGPGRDAALTRLSAAYATHAGGQDPASARRLQLHDVALGIGR